MLMRIDGTCLLVHFAVCQILAWNSPFLRWQEVCWRSKRPYSFSVAKSVLRALDYPKRPVVGDAIDSPFETWRTLSSAFVCACCYICWNSKFWRKIGDVRSSLLTWRRTTQYTWRVRNTTTPCQRTPGTATQPYLQESLPCKGNWLKLFTSITSCLLPPLAYWPVCSLPVIWTFCWTCRYRHALWDWLTQVIAD
jgi:hypothetical protein